jgi:2-C-methyl-D-erythritol 2,4-cyclodiphosphate synthase
MTATVDDELEFDDLEPLVVGVHDTSALGRKVPAFDTDDLT